MKFEGCAGVCVCVCSMYALGPLFCGVGRSQGNGWLEAAGCRIMAFLSKLRLGH